MYETIDFSGNTLEECLKEMTDFLNSKKVRAVSFTNASTYVAPYTDGNFEERGGYSLFKVILLYQK